MIYLVLLMQFVFVKPPGDDKEYELDEDLNQWFHNLMKQLPAARNFDPPLGDVYTLPEAPSAVFVPMPPQRTPAQTEGLGAQGIPLETPTRAPSTLSGDEGLSSRIEMSAEDITRLQGLREHLVGSRFLTILEWRGLQLLQGQLQVHHDDGERIVDLVSDSRGNRPQRGHSFGEHELIFQFFALANIPEDNQNRFIPFELRQQGGTYFHANSRAVATQEVELSYGR